MEDFFAERVINIEGVSYIMRPLKIKELPDVLMCPHAETKGVSVKGLTETSKILF